MDLVVVTCEPDIKLLRHFLASYELYYQNKNNVYIFAYEADKYWLNQVNLPDSANIVIIEEHYPEVIGAPGFNHSLYLKLLAYKVVTTDNFIIMDSDFLFIGPTYDNDFFLEGKPVWYYHPWVEDSPPIKWKRSSEAFVRHEMDYLYLDQPQWIFKREICAKLASTYKLEEILTTSNVAEIQVYGWFAHQYMEGEYRFIQYDLRENEPIVAKINQIPPTYQHLDPHCNYDQYKNYKFVVFWSHWNLAEEKMIEFFEKSQIDCFGKILLEAERNPFVPIAKPGLITHENCRSVFGIFSDGWVTAEVKFKINIPEKSRSVTLEFMVPGNPNDRSWKLVGETVLGDQNIRKSFTLWPGANTVNIQFESFKPDRLEEITVRFDQGFYDKNNPDRREFRARLISIKVG
ncbi:hypothetical protein FJZ55_08330 [Candidatus Woesearchaeota archaeon]|nr:hypothetical protein [Candidatus Woesearchaeota archaeon]